MEREITRREFIRSAAGAAFVVPIFGDGTVASKESNTSPKPARRRKMSGKVRVATIQSNRVIGEGEGLLVKNGANVNPCSLVVHRALSFHPDYHGSNLEIIAALECSYAQNPNGEWPSEYLSGMFDFLAKFRHPLSAFLILRSVPLLIREQRPDGFWEEKQGKYPPDKAVSTFMIVTALKSTGCLMP